MAIKSITPFLWFDHQAEEAVAQYVATFPNSKVVDTVRYTKEMAAASGQKEGAVMTIAFQLDGQDFTAINAGPHFQFSGAVGMGMEGPKWAFDVRAQTSLTPFDAMTNVQNVVYALTFAYRIEGKGVQKKQENEE